MHLIHRGTRIILITGLLLHFCFMTQAQNLSFSERIDLADSLAMKNQFKKSKIVLEALAKEISLDANTIQSDRLNTAFAYYHFDKDEYDSALYYFRPLLFKTWMTEDMDFLGVMAKAINDAGIIYYRLGDLDSAELMHDESLILAKEINNLQVQAFNYNNLALLYKQRKEYVLAIENFEKSLQINRAIPDEEGQGYQYLNMAMLYTDLGQLTDALESYLESLRLFEKLEKDNLRMIIYERLGHYYRKIDDVNTSRDYYNRAFELAQKTESKNYIGRSYRNIGLLFGKEKKVDSAVFYFDKAIAFFESVKYVAPLFNSLDDKGNVLRNAGRLDEVISAYDKALSYTKGNFLSSEVGIKMSKGHALNKLGRYGLAKSSVQTAFNDFPIEKQTLQNLVGIYRVMTTAEQGLGNYKSSLSFLQKTKRLEDSLLNEEKRLEIARIEFEYQLAQEREVFNLENEKQALAYQAEITEANATRNLLIAIAVLFIVILCILFRSYQMKRKANELLRQKAKELKEKNELLRQSHLKEQALMQTNIEEKERRMAAITLGQHEKESLLQKIDDRIQVISKQPIEATDELKSLQRLVRSNLNVNGSWDNFLYQFEKIHPGFFSKTRELFPNMTVNDLKVCAYIKIGMDNKTIAQITNTTVNTVKSRIHRIKKKMELTPEVSIRHYLMSVN